MEDDFQEEDLEAPSVNFDTEIPDAIGDSDGDTPMTSTCKLTFHGENNPETVAQTWSLMSKASCHGKGIGQTFLWYQDVKV